MAGAAHGVVAGYDGSPNSVRALSWAVREARERGTMLTVCHAWTLGSPACQGGSAARDLARRSAQQILDRAVQYAQAVMGPSVVRPLLADGPAAQTLCECSADAAMVVLGSRGQGGLNGLLVGSVSLEVTAHARGPVIVVRGHWRPAGGYLPGPVVVGVDGSEASWAAAEFAADEAALRGAALLAVCAPADTPAIVGGAHLLRDDFEHVVAGCEKNHPELTILKQFADGPARSALLAAARDAQLLVVGARGRGGLREMHLGSVSLAALCYAACPVSVVHPQ